MLLVCKELSWSRVIIGWVLVLDGAWQGISWWTNKMEVRIWEVIEWDGKKNFELKMDAYYKGDKIKEVGWLGMVEVVGEVWGDLMGEKS